MKNMTPRLMANACGGILHFPEMNEAAANLEVTDIVTDRCVRKGPSAFCASGILPKEIFRPDMRTVCAGSGCLQHWVPCGISENIIFSRWGFRRSESSEA